MQQLKRLGGTEQQHYKSPLLANLLQLMMGVAMRTRDFLIIKLTLLTYYF